MTATYRLYECEVEWKDDNTTADVTIGWIWSGEGSALDCDDDVFYWLDHEPYTGQDLGDCWVTRVGIPIEMWRVTYNYEYVIMAFDQHEAVTRSAELFGRDVLDGRQPKVEMIDKAKFTNGEYEVRFVTTMYVKADSPDEAEELANEMYPTVVGSQGERFHIEVVEV